MVKNYLLIIGAICLLQVHPALSFAWCTSDPDCAGLSGGFCDQGLCVCPPGQQPVAGASRCEDAPSYFMSKCFEDFQCSHLVTTFECRRANISAEGNCFCSPGSHYFRGRCWLDVEMGQNCTRDEQCMGVLRDPFSMSCKGTCECADGYYLRQRGECRRIGAAVGDGCVLNEDCRFDGGACNKATFQCYNSSESLTFEAGAAEFSQVEEHVIYAEGSYRSACNTSADCSAPFQCNRLGVCTCPMGYYPNAAFDACFAELGSPVTNTSQCVGLFTQVRDGLCSCQANFYFNEDMRSCVKPARTLNDACLNNENCHTFGANAVCGPPQQWGLRSCQCNNLTVWDENRSMCRLISGIGETCEQDSDCLAGQQQILCVTNAQGQGVCQCPQNLTPQDGLCLASGLGLGTACQSSSECNGTLNSWCQSGVCSCNAGYLPLGDLCVPGIGGNCGSDSDCVTEGAACGDDKKCRCDHQHVEYDDQCWPVSSGYGANCTVSAQCEAVIGATSHCADGSCSCMAGHHYNDGGCWQQTGLFESCSRSSQCYLAGRNDRVHCRNSLCQCTFDFPYSESLGTCSSSSSAIIGSAFLVIVSLLYTFSR